MKAEIQIPTSLSEIPLVNYQKFIKLVENSNDEELIAQKTIEIFCGLKMHDVIKIKWTDVKDLAIHFNNLFKQKAEFKPTFKIEGIEYGFIPNLEEITFGEYVDIEHNIGKIETFHRAMAVMYRPIIKKKGDKYEIIEYTGADEYSDFMKYAPLDVVMSASLFFWNLGNDLVQASLTYLEKEMETNQELKATFQNALNSQNNGDGTIVSMHLLKETLQSLMKLPDWGLENALPTLLTNDKKTK